MKKVIRDGKVAVLYSPGYGAGWSTWNPDFPYCLFDPKLVALVETLGGPEGYKVKKKLVDTAQKLYGKEFYAGAASSLQIAWVPQGAKFRIHEYDGSETVILLDEEKYIEA